MSIHGGKILINSALSVQGSVKWQFQLWWILLLLLITTSVWLCLQYSRNLDTIFQPSTVVVIWISRSVPRPPMWERRIFVFASHSLLDKLEQLNAR